jgi:hypothetical protein
VGLVIAPTVPLDDLAEEHLRALLGEVAEARDLDFKRELPTHDADGKREFLKDVSSLANSGGGDLVYGIDEDNNGVAAAIVPQDFNPDEERLLWEQVLLQGVDPRIPGVRMRPVEVDGGRILLVRVPQSWNTPHAVTFGGMFRFYSRHSTGVYQLDVAELRSAFLAGSALADRIRDFRTERLGLIVADRTPVRLRGDGARVVVHLVPLEAFTTTTDINLDGSEGSGLFQPLFADLGGAHSRWNLDGKLTYDLGSDGAAMQYSQLFRNGIFEGVDTYLMPRHEHADYGGPVAEGNLIEHYLAPKLANPLQVLRLIGASPPIVVLVSIVGARDFIILAARHAYYSLRREALPRIDRDTLLLPDVTIESFDADLPRLMRPVLDALWQAGGWPGSQSYDAEGNWSPPRP